MIRSRLLRYLLTLVLPSGLLCLIFLSSMFHDEQARVRQNLEVAERPRLTVGARSLSSDMLAASPATCACWLACPASWRRWKWRFGGDRPFYGRSSGALGEPRRL